MVQLFLSGILLGKSAYVQLEVVLARTGTTHERRPPKKGPDLEGYPKDVIPAPKNGASNHAV